MTYTSTAVFGQIVFGRGVYGVSFDCTTIIIALKSEIGLEYEFVSAIEASSTFVSAVTLTYSLASEMMTEISFKSKITIEFNLRSRINDDDSYVSALTGFKSGKLSLDQVQDLLILERITQEEYEFLTR